MAVQFGAFGEIEHWEPNLRREPMKIHEDGSIEVVVMTLGVPSPRSGRTYNADDIKRLISKPSFKHRVEGGFLEGEYQLRARGSVNRLMEVRDERICAHFKDVRIEDDEVLARMIPSGPLKHKLEGKVYPKDFDVAMRASVRVSPDDDNIQVAGIISFDIVSPLPVNQRY